jgi:mono/diheme cytochrome c family protein
MKFLSGILVCLMALAVIAVIVLGTGRFNVAATANAGVIETIAPKVRDRSIARHGSEVVAPPASDAMAASRGLSHYSENCLVCHGAPGVKPAEFQQGMNPMPPAAEGPGMQKYTDAELFWIVKNGVRMSGMPAFGGNHSDAEIADIVAFVRHIPQLTPDEQKLLTVAAGGPGHHADATLALPTSPSE